MNDEQAEQLSDEPDAMGRELEAKFKRLVRLKKRAEQSLALSVTMFWFGLLLTHLFGGYPCGIYLLASSPVGAVICAAVSQYFENEYKKNLVAFPNLSDVKHIGVFLNAISLAGPVSSHKLEVLLIRLLPQLQASHSHLFNANLRRKLYALLVVRLSAWTSLHNKSLVLAILRALEQVGDENAIPHVERVVASENYTEVHEAAEQCLLFLRQRAEVQNVSDTLLRPSHANTVAPETLLRPTVARPDEQPATLLRANAAPNQQNE